MELPHLLEAEVAVLLGSESPLLPMVAVEPPLDGADAVPPGRQPNASPERPRVPISPVAELADVVVELAEFTLEEPEAVPLEVSAPDVELTGILLDEPKVSALALPIDEPEVSTLKVTPPPLAVEVEAKVE